MIPAATALAQTAAMPKPRFVGCFVPHGMAPGLLGPQHRGAAWTPRFLSIGNRWNHSGISTVILSGLHSRSAEPPPGATGADHWVAAAFLCADKPKKTAGADMHAGTTIDQIIARKDRPGQPDAVHAARGGGSGREFEQLRRGLQLHLHQHDLLVLAHPAAADGAESAGGVRAHVRRRQHGRAARPRGASGTAAFWIR